jgi:hypothetical protein
VGVEFEIWAEGSVGAVDEGPVDSGLSVVASGAEAEWAPSLAVQDDGQHMPTMRSPLVTGEAYEWRARGWDGTAYSEWSPPHSFTVSTTATTTATTPSEPLPPGTPPTIVNTDGADEPIESCAADGTPSITPTTEDNWMCAEPYAALPIPGDSSVEAADACATTGDASRQGCWTTRENRAYSDFDGWVAYGYAKCEGWIVKTCKNTKQGTAYFSFDVKFSGCAARSAPVRFHSTRAVKSIATEGSWLLINGDNPGGKSVAGTWSVYNHGGKGAKAMEAVVWNGKVGYFSKDSKHQVVAHMHTYSWTDSSHGGTWWVKVKSNIGRRHSDRYGVTCIFDSSDASTPSTATSWGWKS